MAIFSLWSIFQINRLLRLFFGCVKFTFTDGFCEDFINECLVRDLNIINVRRTDNGLTAECSPEEYASIADTARKCGGRTRILKKSGVAFLLSKMQNRMGLSVGIVLGIAVFSLLSGFVWGRFVLRETKHSPHLKFRTFSQSRDFVPACIGKALIKMCAKVLLWQNLTRLHGYI